MIASDLYARREAAISSGPLRTAVAASMAIPGMSRPVLFDGRVLVDGGATNPLPFDRLRDQADIVIAVDVAGPPADDRTEIPNAHRNLSRHHSGDGRRPSSRRSCDTAPPTSRCGPMSACSARSISCASSAILRAAEPVRRSCGRSCRKRCFSRAAPVKKSFSSARGLALADPAIDLRPVMAGRLTRRTARRCPPRRPSDRRRRNRAADAREGDRARAHRAGLERDIEVAIGQPLAAERARRLAGSPAFRHGRSDRGRSSVRLAARATTSPSRTTTQPTGTSPASRRRARQVQRQIHEAFRHALYGAL